MTKSNTAPAWRRAFLCALARGGNATLAAREAGVALGWAQRKRREDAAFGRLWRRALQAFARSAVPAGTRLATPRGALIARRGRGGRLQMAVARESDWTDDKEARFFAELGATLNVKAASAEAGFTSKTAWARRRTDPAFARRWDAVTEEGAHRLELRLMELAARDIGALADADCAAAEDMAEARPVDPDLAKWLLAWRANRAARAQRAAGRHAPRVPDLEALRSEVLRRVEAIRQHRLGASGAP